MFIKCFVGFLIFFTAPFARSSALPPAVRGVVVVSPGVPLSDAKAYALQHDRYLLSDYLEATRPGEDHDQMLRAKLERAQRAWLGGDIENARAEFRAITELGLKADWRNSQREVIQTAYLRLAQTSESGTEREGWLESAVRLYGDLAPNASLFPPPLLGELDATKKRMALNTTEIEIADVFSDFRYVLVDGRKVDIALEPRIRLTTGLHRFTALSDSHEAVTEFLSAAQLRVLRLSPPALTTGRCHEAALRSEISRPAPVDVEIYSGAACPSKISSLLQPHRLLTSERGLSIPEAPEAKENRTWIWIVGAALIAGAGYALATQNHSDSPQATHHSGF